MKAGRLPLRCSLGLTLLATAALTCGGAETPSPWPETLDGHARSVLHQIMLSEESWIKIHAAEALIAAGGTQAIRTYFLNDLPHAASSSYRIGVWRVLATASRTPDERAQWIAKVEQVYLDPTAPDQNQAIETLCKLGHRVSGPTLELVRRRMAEPTSVPKALALWSASLAGEPHALERLTQLLDSRDPDIRQNAAYALRWLHPADPAVRQILARAAATAVPAYDSASVYIVGAALAVEARPAATDGWLALLKFTLITDAFSAAERFEASWTLKHHYKSADLPGLARLLDLPASENDVRVGAASIILTTLDRERSR